LRDLVRQLVNFHPPSREKIAQLLPTIKRASLAIMPAIVKSTESKYFEKQVDSCRYFLSDQEWTRHPTVTKLRSCEIVAMAVSHEFDTILKSVQACEAFKPVSRYQCSRGEFFVDAAIAVLDIGLLLFERHKKLAKQDHSLDQWCACECQTCYEGCDIFGETYCDVHGCFVDFQEIWEVIWPLPVNHLGPNQKPMEDGENVQREWLQACCYANPDGSPHLLRNVLSKYFDLPSLVSPLCRDSSQYVILYQWLEKRMNHLGSIVESGVMPGRDSHPVPDVAALSI